MRRVIIVDTTLRDGSQSPQVTFSIERKIRFAQQLERLRVDVIDAGYPALSAEEKAAVEGIAESVESATVMALAHGDEEEIEIAAKSLEKAPRKRIHLYVPVSDIQRRYLLKSGERGRVLKTSLEMVVKAASLADEVEFTPGDAARTDETFLKEVCCGVEEAGASVINLSDTVGVAIPSQWFKVVKGVVESLKGKAVVSTHCHDDLGVATANSLAALEAGASQIHATIGGVGTRAGNAAVEEIAVALKIWGEKIGVECGINLQELYPTSRLLTMLTGCMLPSHKAVVGDLAFVHTIEEHKMAVVKDHKAVQIVDPQSIGRPSSRMPISRYAGRMMFEQKVHELGYSLSEAQLSKAYQLFSNVAWKKSDVTDADVAAVVEEVISEKDRSWDLVSFSISMESWSAPMAKVRLKRGEVEVEEEAEGNGPIDAAFKAVERATETAARLVDFSVRAITYGKDALGEAVVRVKMGGRERVGRSVRTDVVEAAIRAFLKAIDD
jgi:2-isopropylmalate synthase